MNKLIVYVDERQFLDNEQKIKVILVIDDEPKELFLNTLSINKLKESGKFTVEEKTFTDKILEEFDKNKPGFCKD